MMLISSSSVPISIIILLLSVLNQSQAFQPSTKGLAQFHGGYGLRNHHLQATCTKQTCHSRRNISVASFRSNVQLNLSSSDYNQFQSLQRKGITLPLMDLTSSSSSDTIITPLPACHLPTELSSFHIYGMQLQVAIHKMMIEETLSKLQVGNGSGKPSASMIGLQEAIFGRDTTSEPLYGHLISAGKENEGNGDESELIGAIGCAAEIIISTPSGMVQMETIMEDPSLSSSFSSAPTSTDDDNNNNDPSKENQDSIITVLTKGSFRFIVREVVQTFPYPIVVVDELLDDPISNNDDDYVKEEEEENASSSSSAASSQKEKIYNDFADEYEDDEDFDDDDDDDEQEDIYSHLTPTDLMQRTFSAMKAIVDQKLDVKSKPISPLEQSILEQKGLSSDMASSMESLKRDQAEEMAATLDVFTSSLIDIAPSKTERFYVVAMMAAEFGGLDNDLRRDILVTTNGVERLRKVVKALEKKISFVQAKKLTQDIVEKSDDASKELKVGKPTIPEWAKRLSKGMKIEYYWSEQDGWLGGTIVETVTIVDELIVTVLFDDGETVRLPFDPEEKVRWRPAGM